MQLLNLLEIGLLKRLLDFLLFAEICLIHFYQRNFVGQRVEPEVDFVNFEPKLAVLLFNTLIFLLALFF